VKYKPNRESVGKKSIESIMMIEEVQEFIPEESPK